VTESLRFGSGKAPQSTSLIGAHGHHLDGLRDRKRAATIVRPPDLLNVSVQLHKTRVDLAGLMKVLGEHLYSTPTVALRELVQNAHDSCERRRLEDRVDASVGSRVVVVADPRERTLMIEDTGAGLTADEVGRYLATVGAGYTRTLRDREPDAAKGLIGYFGLGFLSAFVVADRVEVWTCSYQNPDQAWRFVSRDGQTYTLEPAPERPIGTRVTLTLGERFTELANPLAIRRLLTRYASLLQHPVHCPLDGSFDHLGEAVNAEPPPWRNSGAHSDLRQRKLALEFAARFESQFEPLCVLPLGDDGDDEGDDGNRSSSIRGLLWVQDSATYGSSDNRRAWVFVRGMMISDDSRDLLPRWAGFCGVVLETDELTPTASREDLQRDASFDRARVQIREALIGGLAALARRDVATWRRILSRHNEALLGAALCDDRLFDLVVEQATLPTSQGDLSLERIRERSQGRIHISQAERGGFEELLFRALGVPVVKGVRYAAGPIARRWAERRGIPVIALGTEISERALFHRVEDSELADARMGSQLREAFGGQRFASELEVVLSRFAPSHLPFVLVPDREVELKRRIEADEADKRISTAALGLARIFTAAITEGPPLRLHLNLDCPAIEQLGRKLATAGPDDPAAARALALLRPLVALLSQIDDHDPTMSSEQALRELCSLTETLLAN
jgi:molecular chaperone HtpG